MADVDNAQEVVLTASGGMGEAEAGGPVLNLLPKEGGNSISVLTYNQAFSTTNTTWLRPNSVLQPRFVKVSAQVNF